MFILHDPLTQICQKVGALKILRKCFAISAISLWKSIYKTLDKSFGITKNMENYTMLDSTSMNCLRGTFLGQTYHFQTL